MKLSTLVLQLALVVAGLLVYDLLRGSEDGVGATAGALGEGRGGEAAAVVAAPRLQGGALERLDGRIEAVERRQEALERALAQRGASAGAGGAAARASGAPDVADADVEWFRTVRQRASEKDRQEATLARMDHQFDRLGLELSAAQREQVVAAVLRFQAGLRERARPSGSAPEDLEARTAAVRALRAEFERDIHRIVPADDAQKLLQGLPVTRVPLREDASGSGRLPPR